MFWPTNKKYNADQHSMWAYLVGLATDRVNVWTKFQSNDRILQDLQQQVSTLQEEINILKAGGGNG